MKNILNYLRYPSTWKGLVALIAALGLSLKPEYQDAIVTIGLTIGGLIAVKFSDSDVQPPAK
jgi:hypothetical protein